MNSIDEKAAATDLAALDQALGSGSTGARNQAEGLGYSNPGLMEIEIPVAVSFGRARVALKDAMRLTSGSVVRLDRTMTDPVDIMVNGTLVARGEVVEVNGNFAVRVTEVLRRPGGAPRSPEQS